MNSKACRHFIFVMAIVQCVLPFVAFSKTYLVGSGKSYKQPSAVVNLVSDTYRYRYL
jgi:ABC-type uncharacterized transport system YnjBCD permease subunit